VAFFTVIAPKREEISRMRRQLRHQNGHDPLLRHRILLYQAESHG